MRSPQAPAVIPSEVRDLLLGDRHSPQVSGVTRARSLASLGMTAASPSPALSPLYSPHMTLAPAPAPARDYRAEFPIFRDSIYLNSCSLGALSGRSRARVNQCLDLWESRGAAAWYDVWWAALAELRSRYARLVGAPEGTIALHPSIS